MLYEIPDHRNSVHLATLQPLSVSLLRPSGQPTRQPLHFVADPRQRSNQPANQNGQLRQAATLEVGAERRQAVLHVQPGASYRLAAPIEVHY